MRIHGGIAAALCAVAWSVAGPGPAFARADEPTARLIAPTATAPGLGAGAVTDDRTGAALPCPVPLPAGSSPRQLPAIGGAFVPGIEEASSSTDCGDPTRSDARALVLSTVAGGRRHGARHPGTLAGLVPAGAARVVVRTVTGAAQALPVVPTPTYAGPLAGRVAFVLGTARVPVAAIVEARVERADGTLLGVASGLQGHGGDFPLESLDGVRSRPPLRRRVRTSGGTVAFETDLTSTLVPTAADLERRRLGSCTSATFRGRYLEDVGTCDSEDVEPPVPFGGGLVCDARRVVLAGRLPAGLDGGSALLTDGRRVALSVTPPLVAGRRAWTLVAPPGIGVRRLVDVPDAGDTGLAVPPASVACSLADGEELAAPTPTARDVERRLRALDAPVPGTPAPLGAAPAGQQLLGVDGPGGTLCLGVGVAPVVAGCGVLGRDPATGAVAVSRVLPGGRTLVAGVTTATTTGVRIRTIPRGAVEVATAPPVLGYAGAYAGAVRAFAALLPAGRTAGDVRGRVPGAPSPDPVDVLTREAPFGSVDEDDPPVATRPLRRLPAGLEAFTGRRAANARCGVVAARNSAPLLSVFQCTYGRYLTLATIGTPCVARRTVVSVPLEGERARLRVVDDHGRVHEGRRVRLTARVALHVATLPARRALRTIRISGAVGPPLRTSAPRAPSAAAQCGWTAGALAARPSPGDS